MHYFFCLGGGLYYLFLTKNKGKGDQNGHFLQLPPSGSQDSPTPFFLKNHEKLVCGRARVALRYMSDPRVWTKLNNNLNFIQIHKLPSFYTSLLFDISTVVFVYFLSSLLCAYMPQLILYHMHAIPLPVLM